MIVSYAFLVTGAHFIGEFAIQLREPVYLDVKTN